MSTATLPAVDIDRALATIETIVAVHPIPDADAIEAVQVRGWRVVVRKGEFAVGDKALYLEVDSHLDTTDDRFAFLAPRGVKIAEDGFVGHVLKTARLRGVYSQGIVFTLDEFPEVADLPVGTDVTAVLGIRKWDEPIPAEIAAMVRGGFPTFLPKTREDRIENFGEVLEAKADWVATEKIDGTSMSVFIEGDYDGIAGRNYDFERNDEHPMWIKADEMGLHEMLRDEFPNAARATFQGEFFGAGVHPNRLNQKHKHFLGFTVVVDGVELPRNEWPMAFQSFSVPIHDLPFPNSMEEALEQVEDLKSLIAPDRPAEGIVWRAADRTSIPVNGFQVRASVKVVSRRYLAKTK